MREAFEYTIVDGWMTIGCIRAEFNCSSIKHCRAVLAQLYTFPAGSTITPVRTRSDHYGYWYAVRIDTKETIET